MRVELTQFLLPNGRQREVWFDGLPDELEGKVKEILDSKLRFTCEILMTGGASIALEHKKGDFDIELADNGPGENSPGSCLERLIRRFDAMQFKEWLAVSA